MHEAHLIAVEVTAIEGFVRRAGLGHEDIVFHDGVECVVCDRHVVLVEDVDLRRRSADDADGGGHHLVDVDRSRVGYLDVTAGCVALDQRDDILLCGNRRNLLGDIFGLDG